MQQRRATIGDGGTPLTRGLIAGGRVGDESGYELCAERVRLLKQALGEALPAKLSELPRSR